MFATTPAAAFGCGCWASIHRRCTNRAGRSDVGAPEAAKFAADTLTGQRVALVDDPTQDSHDRYGRTLAYVELADGRDFSVTAVAAGMARSYAYDDKPVSRYPDIAAAETQARAARRGLWGPPCEGNTRPAPL